VLASSLAIVAGPATAAHATTALCNGDNFVRDGLNSVNIVDVEQVNAWQTSRTTLGVLTLGYAPYCRLVYAQIKWNNTVFGNGNAIASGYIDIADEYHNSQGRVSFSADGSTWTTSGMVSIDVRPNDDNQLYASPKEFQAVVSWNEGWCSSVLTSNSWEFSTGTPVSNSNGANCSHG
jgi:hypothetical protein